jgi:hypothetical protein
MLGCDSVETKEAGPFINGKESRAPLSAACPVLSVQRHRLSAVEHD